MTHRHVAWIVVIATLAIALLWDIAIKLDAKLGGESWCQAFRDLNKASDGLLGLVVLAVIIHILAIQWFPSDWRHF